MTLSTKQRWSLILGSLLLTLLAMYCLHQEDEEGSDAYLGNKSAQYKIDQRQSLNSALHSGDSNDSVFNLPNFAKLRKLPATKDEHSEADILKSHAWYIPPPPTPVAITTPPPAPIAPPVPYIYMGKLEDGPTGTIIFLSVRDKVQSLTVGQVIDRIWRLDKEDSNSLYITYLPLDSIQVLSKSKRAVAMRSSASDAPQNY